MPESNPAVPKSVAGHNEPSTPEDVATLYSWANLHGAKYRDFSASRAEARELARLRAEEAAAAERRRLEEEEERRRQEEAQIAARKAAEEAEAARQAEAERLAEIARQAEAERQAVLAAQEAQRQAVQQRAWQPPPPEAYQPDYASSFDIDSPQSFSTQSSLSSMGNAASSDNSGPDFDVEFDIEPAMPTVASPAAVHAAPDSAIKPQAQSQPGPAPVIHTPEPYRAAPVSPPQPMPQPYSSEQAVFTQQPASFQSYSSAQRPFQDYPSSPAVNAVPAPAPTTQFSSADYSGGALAMSQPEHYSTSPWSSPEVRETPSRPAWLAPEFMSASIPQPPTQASVSVQNSGYGYPSPIQASPVQANPAQSSPSPNQPYPARFDQSPAQGHAYGQTPSLAQPGPAASAAPAPAAQTYTPMSTPPVSYPSSQNYAQTQAQAPSQMPSQTPAFLPTPVSQPTPLDDTLTGSRDRIANRWYALKSVFDPQAAPAEQVPAQPPARVPVLAVFSLAGGVGKTSLVASLGRALSTRGERVLLVDTAAYGLLPFFFGARDQRPGQLRTFNPPGGLEAPIQLVTLDPDGNPPELSAQQDPNQPRNHDPNQDWLAQEVSRYSRGSNRILIDLPTASGSTTRRILRLAPVVVVPVAPDMNSVVSVGAIESFFRHSGNGLNTGGKQILPYYLLNQFDYALPLHLDVREILREQIGDRLLPFALRRSPAVSEALAEGMTVMDYAPTATVAEDYAHLAEWVRSLSAPATQSYRGVRWSER